MENVDARELQMLQQYLEQFTQQVEAYSRQLEMLDNRRMETATAVETLKTLADQEEPTVLLQIGGGASLRVHVPDTDTVLLNIGSDVVVERTNAETVKYLEERMTEMEALAKKIAESIEQIQKQAHDVAAKLESAYSQAQSRMTHGIQG
ncbi:prefoldin subunit alpha [Methanogenium organophilum]|uniref:Prefoldin subunit alpha n=1 Tax=Methanogenium organophilum TaxID=2199 RepID=A0A9X9T7I1_METOG|nr:prefoldin subunit alpha [Methanogenium organophilum]WAI00715.1 prefoldin subunit alpha [Methanogenium organophilum]